MSEDALTSMPSYTEPWSKSPTSFHEVATESLRSDASISRPNDSTAWPSGTLIVTLWLAPSGHEPTVKVVA